jgi:flagellar biosynthesis/type III secretory pathway protein FliH
VAYSLSTRREALQLEHKLSKVMPDMAREKVMQLTNPFIELGIQRGIQRGLQRGRQEGEIELVLRQLKRRLAVLTASQERAVRQLDLPRIEALSEALLDFTSRADLAGWLRANSK